MAILASGVGNSLPNELLGAIIQELKGDFFYSFYVASTSKLLKSEAEALLYNVLCYTTTKEDRSAHAGMSDEVVSNVGPPPGHYIDNPSLAKYLQSITYVETPGFLPSEDMRMILSAAYSNLLPRLTSVEVTFHFGVPHGFLRHGRFQLDVLRLEGSTLPANLAQVLKRQKALKGLRIVPCNDKELAAIPPSAVANLETLEGPFNVLEALLPSRKVCSLVWEPSASHEDGRNMSIVHLSEQMHALTTLSYPISKNLPPLKTITQYVRNLKYLVINDAWASFARGTFNEGSIIETLPNTLAELQVLCGLTLTSNHYPQRTVPERIMSNLFQSCPTLQFVDVEYTYARAMEFNRWVRGQSQCTVLEKGPQCRGIHFTSLIR